MLEKANVRETGMQLSDDVLVDLERVPWESGQPRMRVKRVWKGPTLFRVLELAAGFEEQDWCRRTHAGYVLEGQLIVTFPDREQIVPEGGAFCIQDGDRNRHKSRPAGARVRLLLIEPADQPYPFSVPLEPQQAGAPGADASTTGEGTAEEGTARR